MSELGLLERLLDSAGVEWKPLEEIANIGTGSRNTNEAVQGGKYPFFVRSQEPRQIDEFEFDETAIITAGDGVGVGKVFHYISGKYALHQRAYRISVSDENVHSKFLFHYIRAKFAEYLKQISVHAAVTSLRMPMFQRFPIPLPCPENPKRSMEIQAEIARKLDSFTDLASQLGGALEMELEIRKKQFGFYREKLLQFDESEVDHFPMGDERVGTFTRGGGLQKKDFAESGVGCIHYGQIYTHYGTYAHTTKSFVSEEFAKKARMAKPGDLVIATTSENDEDVCKAVAWLGDEDIAVSSDACFYSHKLNPKFVAYFFQTEQFQKQKRVHITGAKVRRVNADNLAKILIPVPSAEEQDRVVEILDKFDTLTTSLSEGLPREIKLRQQQYEYYRDLLLSFPIPEEAA